MTEAELLASSDFLGFCGRWQEDRHCPFPLIDWCLDRDWPDGAEAAQWAVEKEERSDGWRNTGRLCVTPSLETSGEGKGQWYWLDGGGDLYSCIVPTVGESEKYFPTFAEAIAYYLTNFDRELAAKYPPKRELVHS